MGRHAYSAHCRSRTRADTPGARGSTHSVCANYPWRTTAFNCFIRAKLTLSATCAATGLAIMAPGISHACGICGLRTLSATAVQEAAEKHGVSLAVISEAPVEACGGCGGKFIA